MVAITPLVLIFVVFVVRGADSHAIARPNLGIVGGHRVSIESVPFMVSVSEKKDNHTFHLCGGSIIHQQFILTAAHCLLLRYPYVVKVGTDDLETGGTTYNVSKLIQHEKFCNKTGDYDIGLVKLSTPLQFGKKVGKIALPKENFNLNKGSHLRITGWGKTGSIGTDSKDLLQVTVPLVSKRNCELAYQDFLITPRMFCAGDNGKTACKGDSGSPIFLNDIQVGVHSLGNVECGVPPGIFTNVTLLTPWIKKTISENL